MRCFTQEVPLSYAAAGLALPTKSVQLTLYLPDMLERPAGARPRPLVVLCPGGGYTFVSPREGEPVALRFLAADIAVAELDYSVAPARFPTALFELAATVRFAREHAAELAIDPNRIIVSGFSAGGHLAASLCVYWNQAFLAQGLAHNDAERAEARLASLYRPDGAVLCYPVISGAKGVGHEGSIESLYGKDFGEAERQAFSLEQQVGPHCPPAFLWHTAADKSVPPENSLRYAMALSASHVPFELHVYPTGSHGLSLATEAVGVEETPALASLRSWMDLAIAWVRR
jgi:acetyl esterase/lipase